MPNRYCDLPVFALTACIAIGLLACGPSDPLQQARDLQARGDFEASLEPLREILATAPDSPEASFRYGVALNRAGKPELAVWSLRTAAAHDEWQLRANMELASGALQLGNYPSALEAVDALLGEDPDDVPGLMLRAEIHLRQKAQPELALADLERVLELQPDHVSARASQAAARIMLDRIDEAGEAIATLEDQALEASQGAAGEAPSDAVLGRFCVTKALFANDRGEAEEALTTLEGCIERYPTERVVVEEAIAFFDARGQPERATEVLTAALAARPVTLHYRTGLASRLRLLGDVPGAEKTLRGGLELGGPRQRSSAWLALADHFIAMHELDPAIEAFRQSLALLPDPPVAARLEYADLLARAKHYDEALEIAKEFANEGYRGLIEARIHYDNDRPKEALERLEQVFTTWPNNPGARYYAARSAEQLGDFNRAIEEYRQSLRSGAHVTEAGLRLAKLHRALGDVEGAFVALGHHFGAHPDDREAVAFLVRLTNGTGNPKRVQALFQTLRTTPHHPFALAIQANVVAEQEGPAAAVARIRAGEQAGFDLTAVDNAPLLRSLIRHLGALGRHDECAIAAAKALEAHPEVADFHEIQGIALELREAPAEEVRAAYLRAVELDSKHARALEALGRAAADEKKLDEALGYLDRATEARPERASAARRAAQLVDELGTSEAAERRWEGLLKEHPWEGRAAFELAKRRHQRGDRGDRTVRLAHQALRFGRSAEAAAVVTELHEARGEPERAAEVRRLMAAAEAQRNAPAVTPEG